LEASRREPEQHAAGFVASVRELMHDAARPEHKRAFAGMKRLVAPEHERGLALNDVEPLILVVVDVRRRPGARRADLLDQAQRVLSLLARGLEGDEMPQHPRSLAFLAMERD